ncbi:uracil-DNA glycosylase [Pseudoramibacter sp.]|uniref:uracil-DNA glycosylase n=1 Tax=Pseudoramibacter sp. TaxID=2034862 RepID=UPI0025F6F9A8|nr:uracil-DNA glycosylase [Pseudoramibacter sp.]MCH4071529.1 uracil-DNA glycosylase [Pseudoramibacter sp.]MCH4105297.1 uracil-DNA glycosylase [Pseudoramibacter sp.]
MSIFFQNDWEKPLKHEFKQDYYQKLRQFLIREYKTRRIYPNPYDIFNAFHYTAYKDTKVCIIGQDPYHGPHQAHGLCFSVQPDVAVPPSLQNIYKELHDDLGCAIPNHGCLVHWTKEGVLLLNSVLTVRAGQPASHRGKGWEIFTDHVIEMLNARETPVVFILWGAFAQSKIPMITNPQHMIIKSAHPSPLAAHRGFFGSRPFSRANEFLTQVGLDPVDWAIPSLKDPKAAAENLRAHHPGLFTKPGEAVSS